MKKMYLVPFLAAFFAAPLFSLPAHSSDTVIYSYDDAGRLTKVKYFNGKTIEYTYDKAGNLLERKASATTATACEAESLAPSPAKLSLKKNEGKEATITVEGKGGCPSEGELVTAEIDKAGKNKITVSPLQQVSDENGHAVFTVTAGDKPANATVKFTCNGLSKTLTVKAGK